MRLVSLQEESEENWPPLSLLCELIEKKKDICKPRRKPSPGAASAGALILDVSPPDGERDTFAG